MTMQALTDATAALTAAAEAYNGKAAEIDDAVQAALAAAPTMSRDFHVDQAAGDDSNDGSSGSPLASIDEAIARTPLGGSLRVRLSSSYTVASRITFDSKDVWITAGSSNLSLNFDFYEDGGEFRLGHFDPQKSSSLIVSGVSWNFPTSPPGSPMSSLFTSTIMLRNFPGSGHHGIYFHAVDFYHNDRTGLSILRKTGGAVSCSFVQGTFQSDFEGMVFHGEGGAGVSLDTLPRDILTNIDWI